MWETAAPFIIGVILQVGGAIGVVAVGSQLPAARTERQREQREVELSVFARRADAAQSVAACAALIASGVLVPALAGVDRGVYVAVSAVVSCGAYTWITKQPDHEYRNRGLWILSPLNIFMIVVNAIFAAIILAFY